MNHKHAFIYASPLALAESGESQRSLKTNDSPLMAWKGFDALGVGDTHTGCAV